jgi:hypothetical protein
VAEAAADSGWHRVRVSPDGYVASSSASNANAAHRPPAAASLLGRENVGVLGSWRSAAQSVQVGTAAEHVARSGQCCVQPDPLLVYPARRKR